ncbi:MAG: hypothetical protein GX785_11415 [Armatimonadetes bacterium]|nr:hypothetical protein [Armatimonadota bacterium]
MRGSIIGSIRVRQSRVTPIGPIPSVPRERRQQTPMVSHTIDLRAL